jgi:hypothetical protein
MIGMSDNEVITIRVPNRVWNGMSGEVENAIILAAEDGDEDGPVIDIGADILESSARQCRQAGVNESTPEDQMIAIALTREQWGFILDQGERSTSYEELGDGDSLALIRDARAAITVQLAIA